MECISFDEEALTVCKQHLRKMLLLMEQSRRTASNPGVEGVGPVWARPFLYSTTDSESRSGIGQLTWSVENGDYHVDRKIRSTTSLRLVTFSPSDVSLRPRNSAGSHVLHSFSTGEVSRPNSKRCLPSCSPIESRFSRDCGHYRPANRSQAALANSSSIRSQISTSAAVSSSIIAALCAGPGVKRSRSVPRGTVGKLIG